MKEKILVYGAGVIGSIHALRLAKAGHPVCILARGERLAALRSSGLRIRNVLTEEEESADVEVLERLDGQEDADLAVVALRSGQVTGVLRLLGAMPRLKAIAAFGNNLEDLREEAAAAGAPRFVPGFGAFGGYREGPRIDYLDGRSREKPGAETRSPTTLGVLSEAARPALMTVRSVLERAGLPCVESPDIASWLVCHAALVLPLAGAVYASGGDQARLCRTRDAMILGVRACREAMAALRSSGIRIEPPRLRKLLATPEWLLVRILTKNFAGEPARVAMFGHANAAGGRGEIGGQARVLDGILRKPGSPLPHWDRLLPWFDPGTAPMPDGRKSMRLRIW